MDMKRVVALAVALMWAVSAWALAAAPVDLMPDGDAWGRSRTNIKGEFEDVKLQEVEVGEYKALTASGVAVSDYPMDVYFVFGVKEAGKSYYGLSSLVYMLPLEGGKKISDANLTKCYKALLKNLRSELGKPDESNDTRAAWITEDCLVELSIGKYKEYNGSSNKTVALSFARPDGAEEAKPSPTAKPKASGAKMTVTAEASCSNYNHVGGDWTQVFYVNGRKVAEGASVTLKAGDTVTVKAEISENDSTPDEGSGEKSYTVTAEDVAKGFTVKMNVTVAENSGRYKGNKATWSVKFTFK